MRGETETLRAALSDVCEAERRWREATEARDRLASDAALRHAADRGRRLLGGRPAEDDPARQWVDRHLED